MYRLIHISVCIYTSHSFHNWTSRSLQLHLTVYKDRCHGFTIIHHTVYKHTYHGVYNYTSHCLQAHIWCLQLYIKLFTSTHIIVFTVIRSHCFSYACHSFDLTVIHLTVCRVQWVPHWRLCDSLRLFLVQTFASCTLSNILQWPQTVSGESSGMAVP